MEWDRHPEKETLRQHFKCLKCGELVPRTVRADLRNNGTSSLTNHAKKATCRGPNWLEDITGKKQRSKKMALEVYEKELTPEQKQYGLSLCFQLDIDEL